MSAPGDLLFKLNKKIAQLTRVIYLLNSKQENKAYEFRETCEAYELEIKTIMESSLEKLCEVRNQLKEKDQTAKLQKALDDLTQKHEGEKAQFIQELEAYKASTEKQMSRMQNTQQDSLSLQQSKIEKCCEGYQTTISTFENEFSKIREKCDEKIARYQKQIKNLNLQKEEEVAGVLRTSNDKYNAMLKEQTDKYAKLHSENLDKIAECEKAGGTIVSLEEQLREAKQQNQLLLEETSVANRSIVDELNSRIGSLEERNNELTIKNVNLGTELTKLREENEKWAGTHADQAKKMASLEQTCTSLERQTLELKGDLLKVNNEKAGFEKQLNQVFLTLEQRDKDVKALEGIKRELETGKKAADDANSVLDAQNEELSSEIATLKDRNRQQLEEINTMRAKQNQLGSSMSDTQAEISRLVDENQILSTKVKALEVSLEKQENALNTAKTTHARELEIEKRLFEKEKEKLNAWITEVEGEVAAKTEEITAVVAAKNKAVAEKQVAIDELESSVSKLSTERDTLFSELKKSKLLVLELQHQLQSSNSNSSDAMQRLKEELIAKQAELDTASSEIMAKNDEIEKEKTSRTTVEAERDDLLLKIEDLSEKQRMMNDQLDAKTQQMSQLEDSLAELRNTLEMQKDSNEVTSTETKKLQTALLTMQSERDRLEKEKVALQRQITDAGKKMAELRIDFDEHIKTMQKNHKQEISDIKESTDHRISVLEEELEFLKSSAEASNGRLSNEMDSVRNNHRLEVERLKKAHEELMAAHKTKFESEIEGFKEQMARAKQLAIDDQYSLEQRLSERHAEEISRLEKVRDELRAQSKKMFDDFDAKLNKQREREKNVILEYEAKINGYVAQLSAKDKELTEMRETLQGTLRNVTSLESQHTDHQDALRQLKIAHQRELIELENTLEREMQSTVNRMVSNHKMDIEKLKKEIQSLERSFDEERMKLNEKVEEYHNLYLERPSRPEDLEFIEQLKLALDQRTEELEEIKQQMQYFKLELVNRDENYTKMFGGSVGTIGTLDPLQKKKKKRGMSSGPKSSRLPPLQRSNSMGNINKPKRVSSGLSINNNRRRSSK
ncbi:hypothetical protein PCE1_004652 [Barthelona sp. PCE]